MRTVSIGSMVKQLSGMLGTRDLTQWQQDFVRNAYETSKQGADTSLLSEKQVEIVDTIFRDHFA